MITLTSVEPSNVILTSGAATVHVMGQFFLNDEQNPYQCIASGVAFNATFVNSQMLQCALQFTTDNMPGGSSSQGNYIYVAHGMARSNILSLYFSAAPIITGGAMSTSSRIRLTGSNFVHGALCEFRSGAVSVVTLKGNTATCEIRGVTADTHSFDVRIYSFGQVSNWFTIQI